MKPVKHLPDESLKYIASDCRTAIAVYPDSLNTERYLATMRACEREQQDRARVRMYRRWIAESTHDPLAVQPIRARRFVRQANNAYRWDRFRSGCTWIGWYRAGQRLARGKAGAA